MLLGITLRIENPSKNHYYGSPARIGRSLAESRDRLEFERLVLEMIGDKELDDLNRLVLYYTFLNYQNNTTEKSEVERILQKTSQARNVLPDYIRTRL